MLLGLGILKKFVRSQPLKEITLFLCFLLSFLLYSMSTPEPPSIYVMPLRYLFGFSILLLPWVGVGAYELEVQLKKKYKYAPLFVYSLLIFTLLPFTYSHIKKMHKEEGRLLYELREAGLYIKKKGVKNPCVLSPQHVVAYYADGECITTPWASYKEIIEYAREKRVDYIVIYEREIRGKLNLWPQLFFLLDPANCPPELKLFYDDKGKWGKGRRVLIYRLIR
jgi:hypothetical protein